MLQGHKKLVLSHIEFIFLGVHFCSILYFLYWGLNNWNVSCVSGYEFVVFPWIAISFLINLIMICYVGKATYTDCGLIFVICSYLFMFGHVFIKVFGLKTTLLWDPSIYFSESDKLHGAIYAIGCLLVFSFVYGIKISVSDTEKSIDNFKNKSLQGLNSEWIFKLGWIFFAIGMVASLMTWGKIIAVTMATGSYASYTTANTSGIFDDFAYLLAPGVIYILCSKKIKRSRETIFVVLIMMFYISTMIFSGSRKTQIFAMVAIGLCYLSTGMKRKNNASKILFIVMGIIFLDLIYVIRENRFNLSTIGPTFIDSIRGLKFLSSIAGETLAETGISFLSVVAVMGNVPSVFPYELGMTFIRTIPSILPIGWLVGDFFNKAASSYVINRYTRLPVGTSLLGDFYWNFGIWGGVLLCVVFAIIVSKISKLKTEKKKDYQYFSLLYIVLMGVRAGIFEIFRPLMIVLLVPYVIEILLRGKITIK